MGRTALLCVAFSLLLVSSYACGDDDSKMARLESDTTISGSNGVVVGSGLPVDESDPSPVEVEALKETDVPVGEDLDTVRHLGSATNVAPNDSRKAELNIFDAIAAEDLEGVRWHVQSGTDLEAYIPLGWPWAGASPLHIAAIIGNEEILQLLLDAGVNIDIEAEDDFGGTPLHWSAFFGVTDVTMFLVNAGADINAADNYGCSVLCAAGADNPWVEGKDEEFEKARSRIRAFLKAEGAKN